MSIDEPLEKIVAGTWDRDYELTMQRDLKQLQEAMQSQPDEAVLAMIEEHGRQISREPRPAVCTISVPDAAGTLG